MDSWRCNSQRAVARRLLSRSRRPAVGQRDDPLFSDAIVEHFTAMQELARAAAPYADSIVATADGRRRATEFITTEFEHIPAELIAHQICGVAACADVGPALEVAVRDGWSLAAECITCPVRVVWGTNDKVLPVAIGRNPLPRGMAPACRLGRPRRCRPLPAAGRATRSRGVDRLTFSQPSGRSVSRVRTQAANASIASTTASKRRECTRSKVCWPPGSSA